MVVKLLLAIFLLSVYSVQCFACKCMTRPSLELLINKSSNISTIKIISIDKFENNRVQYEIVSMLKGTDRQYRFFFDEGGSCGLSPEIGEMYLYFDPVSEEKISMCSTNIVKENTKINSLLELKKFAHITEINNAANHIQNVINLCKQNTDIKCAVLLKNTKNKVCVFDKDNPKECGL